MKKALLYITIILSGTLAGCNSFLDKEPITNVSTEAYLYMESDLAAYSASYYGNLPSHSGYGLGTFDDDNANLSPRSESTYLLPYRKNSENTGFDGLTWNQAKYLIPISADEFRLTTEVEGSSDYRTSSIYQNPGWSYTNGELPEGE